MELPQTFAATIGYYNMRFMETWNQAFKDINNLLHMLDRTEMPFWTATPEPKESIFQQLYI